MMKSKLLAKHLLFPQNSRPKLIWIPSYKFSQPQSKFRIVQDPKDANKLVFDHNGKCRIFEHKNGERQVKWVMRVATTLTVINSFLVGMEMSNPVFGAWNMFSFSSCAGLGYLFLLVFQVLAKRTVQKIELHNNLELIDVYFFNPFWKQQKMTFHISQCQQLWPSYAGFFRFEITSIGKVWIKIQKNEFRGVKDYQQTLDSILLGKKITNIALTTNKSKE